MNISLSDKWFDLKTYNGLIREEMAINRCNKGLELSAKLIGFESVSKSVNVFYDEINQHVFVVTNRCADGVVVKAMDEMIAQFRYTAKTLTVKKWSNFVMIWW